jgi:hypothetical protein
MHHFTHDYPPFFRELAASVFSQQLPNIIAATNHVQDGSSKNCP